MTYPEGVPRRTCKKDLTHPVEGIILEKGKAYLTTPDATLIDGIWCLRVFTRYWVWVSADDYFEGCEHFSKDSWAYEI